MSVKFYKEEKSMKKKIILGFCGFIGVIIVISIIGQALGIIEPKKKMETTTREQQTTTQQQTTKKETTTQQESTTATETIINENKTIYLNYIAIKYSFENIPEGINITTLDGQEKVSVTEDTKLFYNQEINLSYTVKAGHHLTNLKITGLEQVSDLQLINNDDNSLTYSSNYVVKGFSSDDAREVNLGLNYTQDVNIYTLTFNNEGEITTQNVAYNELAQITTNPSKEKDHGDPDHQSYSQKRHDGRNPLV